MELKIKTAKRLKAGNVILMKSTDISFIPAVLKSVKSYGKMDVSIEYEFTMYGKTYDRKLIVPNTDVVLMAD